ncbi:MAG: signal peptidase I [Thermoplasmata archaeon]|nr:MAG: signal peptidase I [Thermoplasmata archaeon]
MDKDRLFNRLLLAVVSLVVLSFIIIPLADKSSRWYIVASGSMEPTLKVGDMVFVSHASMNEIKIGDIISFNNEERNYAITHRCVDILHQSNTTYFKTKGDANEENDSFFTPENALIGKVPYTKLFGHVLYAKIPRIGYLSYFTHTKIGFLLLILFPSCALIGIEIYNIASVLKNGNAEKEKKKDA